MEPEKMTESVINKGTLKFTYPALYEPVRLQSRKKGNRMEKNCETCINNDYSLCDLKGILVEDEDSCESWKGQQEWKDKMLNTFLAGH